MARFVQSISEKPNKMKKITLIICSLLLISTTSLWAEDAEVKDLSQEEFLEKIFDYRTEKEWSYKGDTPVLIDFYATWCMPCKQVAPVLEELQKEYGKELQIYKVNVDKEKELAAVFGVRAMPSFLFIPKQGLPTMAKGAMPKENFIAAFKEYLGIKPLK